MLSVAAERIERADRLHQRARRANAAYDFAGAHRLLGQAIALAGLRGPDAPASLPDLPADLAALVSRIFATWALCLAELRGLPAGLAILDRAAELSDQYRGLDGVVSRVGVANQRGILLLRAGHLDEALEEFALAESHFAVGSPLENCNVLLNRGAGLLTKGDGTAARAVLARCVKLADRAEIPIVQGMARHNLGYAEFLLGNLVAALDAMTAASAAYDLPLGISGLDRARVLNEAGLTREADLVLADVAAGFTRARDAQDLAETELERARCALVVDDVPAARRLAMKARDRFRRRGNAWWRRRAELVLLQGDLAAGRPAARLLAPALRLRSEFADAGQPLLARTATLIAAQAALRAGRLDHARALLAEVGRLPRDEPITARVHAYYARAALARAEGRPAVAARLARRGLQDLAAHQARFGSIDLQTAAAVHGRRLAQLDVSIALKAGRPEGVLDAVERARAVSNRLVNVRPPADPAAAALLAELRQVVESLHGAPQSSDDLRRRRRALEREIAGRGWTIAGSGHARAAAGLGDIEDALAGDGSTLVSYVQADGSLHALVIGATASVYPLGAAAEVVEQVRRLRADLDVLAQSQLPDALRVAVAASARRSAERLDAELLAPLDVDGRRLVIVSTGVLGQLPWAMLPSLRQVPVVVAPSASAWARAVRRRGGHRRRTVFALAGPDVPNAARELRGVARAWRSASTEVRPHAVGADLTRALSRGGIVHIAAHGFHNTENALFSSLRLADGVRFAHELDRTPPEHVVLSACELGLATVLPGDEALGLTSVLLRLGSRSVVAGVARVQDDAAATTMIAYHQGLARGSDSAQALADAVAAADGAAPFVCFGAAWSPAD